MFVNNISRAHITESEWSFNVKSSTYHFHVRTNTLANFHICISVPLRNQSREKCSKDF